MKRLSSRANVIMYFSVSGITCRLILFMAFSAHGGISSAKRNKVHANYDRPSDTSIARLGEFACGWRWRQRWLPSLC